MTTALLLAAGVLLILLVVCGIGVVVGGLIARCWPEDDE